MEKNEYPFEKQIGCDEQGESCRRRNGSADPFDTEYQPVEDENVEEFFKGSNNNNNCGGHDVVIDERKDDQECSAGEEQKKSIRGISRLLGTQRERMPFGNNSDNPIDAFFPSGREKAANKTSRRGDGRLMLAKKRGSRDGAIEVPRGHNVVIGRTEGLASVVLNFKDVSEQHAEITFDHGAYYLSHLSRTNETCINGEPLVHGQQVEIQRDDKIMFASRKFYAFFEDN